MLLLKIFTDEMKSLFCPVCGAKRPEPEKSELERLFGVHFNDVVNDLRIDGKGEYFRELAIKLASAAERWFREKR